MHHRGRSPPGASGSPSAPIGGPGAGGGGRRPPGRAAPSWSGRPPAPAGAVGQRVAQGDPRRAPRPEGGPGAGHRRVVVQAAPLPQQGHARAGAPAGHQRVPALRAPLRPPGHPRPGAHHELAAQGGDERQPQLLAPAPATRASRWARTAAAARSSIPPLPLVPRRPRCAVPASLPPPAAGRPRTGACPSPWSWGRARHLGRAGESGPGPPGRETPAAAPLTVPAGGVP